MNGSSVSLRPSASTAIAPPFEDARHEVVDAGVAPELDLLGDEARRRDRIVERDGVAGVEPRASIDERARQRAAPRRAKPVVADRREVAASRVVGAASAPCDRRRSVSTMRATSRWLEADDVEVAVQVARERDERAAVVVAIAVEDAIERVLHRVLHRPRQQHDDQRRQQRR